MQPNPYESPHEVNEHRRRPWLWKRLQRITLVELLVILAVIIVIVALFLPDFDETRTDVLRKYPQSP
jgi:competence protein ComGC